MKYPQSKNYPDGAASGSQPALHPNTAPDYEELFAKPRKKNRLSASKSEEPSTRSPSPPEDEQASIEASEERVTHPPPRLYFPTVFLLVFCAYASMLIVRLANAPVLLRQHVLPLGVYLGLLLFVGIALRISRYRGDGALVAAVMALCGMGVVVQFRIGTLQWKDGGTTSTWALPIGITAMMCVYWICRRGRQRRLEAAWLVALIASVLAVGVVLVLGRTYRGAVFLPGNINPVEIIKPLLIVFLASVLHGHRQLLSRRFLGVPLPPINVLVTVAVLWALPMGMLLLQKDLGLITLLNAVLLIMLYAATRRSGYFLGGIAAVLLLSRFAVPLSEHATRRFEAWLDPFVAATGSGWQILQGLVALYSGGMFGTGLGTGTPQAVPIVESDFVYVIFGEELGFIGCGLLLMMYVLLTLRGFGVAARTKDEFSSLLATGITACFALQTLMNVGGVTKAMPLTGITLPFISHGGSSLIAMLVMTGLLMAISED